MKGIGNTLKRLMKQKGYTQVELAEKCYCTEASISRYVNNLREPSLQTLKRLAATLETTIDELVKES